MRIRRPSSLYRLFSISGELLYIGITIAFERRMYEHSRYTDWYADVDSYHTEQIIDRRDAMEAEEYAIKTERPIHNIRHNREVAA
jgi:predicted GIY-YIG superfamily endonuclease